MKYPKIFVLIFLLSIFAIASCSDEKSSNDKSADTSSQQAQQDGTKSTADSNASAKPNDAKKEEKLPPLSSLWLTLNTEAETSLLLGIFYKEDLANNSLQRLNEKKIDASVLKMANESQEPVFIILSGKFKTPNTAEVEQFRLKSHFGLNSKLVNFVEVK